MKILAVHPGASYSTADVWSGVIGALAEQGHEISHYRLDGRIAGAGSWLHSQVRRAKRLGQSVSYTSADVVYQASVGCIERALRLQPDWVLVVSGMYFHPDAFIMLKRAGIRTAVILTESPYDEEKEARILPYVDIAWTNERTSAPRLREMSGNPHVYYLPHAYDPSRHYPGEREGDATLPAHDVVFVGTYFQERIEILSAVDWSGIDLGLYGDHTQLPSRSKLRKYIAGGVTDNATTAALYRRAKIGLNLHRTSKGFGRTAPRIEHAESLNPRAYELAASGCFVVSDWRDEFDDRPIALDCFQSPDGLESLIRYYLVRPDERAARIACTLNAVQGETFAARAQQIMGDLERVRYPLVTAAG